MGRTYKSMQGKDVDMEKLMRQNELMPAIGNIRVNARGDELGPGGKIIRKREKIMADYYENNPKSIRDQNNPIEVKPRSGIIEPKKPQIQEEKVSKKSKPQVEDEDEQG